MSDNHIENMFEPLTFQKLHLSPHLNGHATNFLRITQLRKAELIQEKHYMQLKENLWRLITHDKIIYCSTKQANSI